MRTFLNDPFAEDGRVGYEEADDDEEEEAADGVGVVGTPDPAADDPEGVHSGVRRKS